MTTKTALEIAKTSAKLPEVLRAALAPEKPAVSELTLSVCDRPVVPTIAFKTAVKRITTTDPITVTERRLLEQDEVDALSAERAELDALDEYIKARRAAHKTMVFNHLDLEAEADGATDDRDPETGHFIKKGQVESTGSHMFTRELRVNKATMDADDVKAYAEDDSNDFTHRDYLDVTIPVRVIDEGGMLTLLRKEPAKTVAMMAAVGKPGSTTASLNRRKKK